MAKILFGAILGLFLLSGCSLRQDNISEKKILSPETVEVYDVSIQDLWKKRNYGRELLKGFPFVSNEPIVDFRGKFSDQFYGKIDYRYKFASLKDVDFWKLRTNPFLEDFIYVLPMWANNFMHISNDLFEDIGFSYNLSTKEQEILKWWIGEGGILWIEGGIYSTRYDTFNKIGEIDTKALIKNIIKKSSNLTFFDRKVKTYMYMAKKLDNINFALLSIKYKTHSSVKYFSDIKNLQVISKNFLNVDFMPKGKNLLFSKSGKPLVTFIPYGKGGVVFLRAFDFQNKMYDGELLRWRLLYYLLNRMYIEKHKKNNPYKFVKEKFDNNQTFSLHNLHFAYKSSKLSKESITLLKPIANYLIKHPSYKIIVAGHTDDIGSAKYNKKLSYQRANSVKKALIELGVSSSRITAKGYGEDIPIAPNTTEQGRAKNRRVEFTIIK